MTRTPGQWFEEMREIWVAQEPEKLSALLSDDITYHEDPLAPPLTSPESILNVWQEVKEQKIDYVKIELLYEDIEKGIGVALWHFKQTDQPEHVGSYFLELDKNGRCKTFRQWWNTRERK